MAALLNVAQLNPMHARDPDRLDDIIHHMSSFDIVILTGTGYKAPPHYSGTLSQRRTGLVNVLDAGYGSGRHTNKSTGISFIYRGNKLRPQNLVAYGAMSGAAKGRAAYVRFKVHGNDLAFFGIYYPPKPNTAKDIPKYLETCTLITEWVHQEVCKLPGQCNPILAMDLNDGIGKLNVENGKFDYTNTTVIEEHAARRERLHMGAGHRMRLLAEALQCTAHTANWDSRDTWHSPSGVGASLIDYILAPQLLSVHSAGTLARLGRKLQPIAVNRPADHWPVYIAFYLEKHENVSAKIPLPPKNGVKTFSWKSWRRARRDLNLFKPLSKELKKS